MPRSGIAPMPPLPGWCGLWQGRLGAIALRAIAPYSEETG